MKAYRIKITSWTSSFRYPNLISGFQPTLEVPPISTVLGLINAASGKYMNYKNDKIGYYFEYEAKTVDLETIYQIELTGTKQTYPSNNVKSNVINREFLFNCSLYIYLTNNEIIEYLRKPVYQLLLGRSNDLATVESIEDVELVGNNSPENLKGQIIPFAGNYLAGEIQALPKYFTDTIPRNNIGTEAFTIISCFSGKTKASIKTYTDTINEKEIDIYFHELNF
jgi:CRISPR-associated protein Cas5t